MRRVKGEEEKAGQDHDDAYQGNDGKQRIALGREQIIRRAPAEKCPRGKERYVENEDRVAHDGKIEIKSARDKARRNDKAEKERRKIVVGAAHEICPRRKIEHDGQNEQLQMLPNALVHGEKPRRPFRAAAPFIDEMPERAQHKREHRPAEGEDKYAPRAYHNIDYGNGEKIYNNVKEQKNGA